MQQLAAFKDTARATWATGDYDAMMRQEGLYEVGVRLVRQLDVGVRDAVLDIACGTGNAAIPAARAGARVTGLDLTPEMLTVARARAGEAGVEVTWIEGDAEDLPFDDGSFDVVLSTFGTMFAPRHEVVADEIARVLRIGGRLGLCTWTPEGVIGDFFRTLGPHLSPLPDFVDPPLAWGDEAHVRQLFEGTGVSLRFRRESWEVTHASVEAAVACYADNLGPVAQARGALAVAGGWMALHDDLAELFARCTTAGGGIVAFPAEYLLVTGRKAG